MALSVTIRLLTDSYDAGATDDRARAEWPPHPARLFCALTAAARGEADRAALRWLETQRPPMVWAAPRAEESATSGYVVTNRLNAAGGSQSHPGRTNGLRTRVRSHLSSPFVNFVWQAADPAQEVVAALDAMARRVPYLGRSTGIALVSAEAADATTDTFDGALVRFEPCDVLDAELSLRVPYPGYLDQLIDLHASDRPAWEASRFLGYRSAPPIQRADSDNAETSAPMAPSAYPDIVIFRINGFRPDGRLAPRFTAALRSRVLASARDRQDCPAVLHGHGADGRPHVAFLALPDVGGDHADGHLLGLAVAVPDLPPADRRSILAAVLALRADGTSVSIPDLGDVPLTYEPGLVRPWGATPERWRTGGRRWVSATPVVLDRYPKGDGGIEAEVLRSCRTVGLPNPVTVDLSKQPMMPGAVRMLPGDLPPKLRGRPFRHVSLTFDRPVAGPFLLGAGRYLGVGLFAPFRPEGHGA